MKTLFIKIVGETPLLVNRFNEEAEFAKPSRAIRTGSLDPRTEAAKAAYVAKDGSLYVNAFSIPACMANAGSNHKMRGSRKSLRFIVPSAVRMFQDTITILDDEGRPAENFEVDARPVTIPATKGRVMRYRPRFDKWSLEFHLVLNDDLLSIEDAQRLLVEGGQTMGIGDFRPEKRGPFGTFRVTRFEESTK